MGAVAYLQLLLTHPLEFRTLLQYKLYHEFKRDITNDPHSGWERASMRRCWYFLDQTSRSFAAVIKELEGDLARTICLFYLVLRGLDTIEDDMTIPDSEKQPLLRNFHNHTLTPGWRFTGSGPNEKDRQLLIEYHNVVEELNILPPDYRAIIVDIAQKMATGMADYSHKAAQAHDNTIYLSTIEEYELYCHYVAGLVGEGLSKLFSASGKETAWLGDQLELSNSLGLFLQKTNIIRDYREDVEERRFFWPKEIWAQERFGFSEMEEMYAPGSEQNASWVQSGMILNAMRHCTDALDYLKSLRNQSVFNFVAIPQTMAIATLELCFRNPDMFQRNIKIRKAKAADLIMRSTNTREVAIIFREYTRKIHAKAVPEDPYYLQICLACARVDQWFEHHYPSFVHLSPNVGDKSYTFDPSDARTRIVLEEKAFIEGVERKQRLEDIRNGVVTKNAKDMLPMRPISNPKETRAVALNLGLSFLAISGICLCVVWVVLRFGGGGEIAGW